MRDMARNIIINLINKINNGKKDFSRDISQFLKRRKKWIQT